MPNQRTFYRTRNKCKANLFWSLSFFFAHTGIIFVKNVWFCFHMIAALHHFRLLKRSSFQAYFKFFSHTETLGYKISDLWKSKTTTATRDQFLLQWEKVMWLISSTTTLVSRWIIGIGFSQLPSTYHTCMMYLHFHRKIIIIIKELLEQHFTIVHGSLSSMV